KKQAYYDPANYVPEDDLKKRKVGIERKARNADDGQRAGFSGDNRERDRPPRNIAIRKKVVTQRALRFPKPQAKKRDSRQVRGDDGQVQRIKPVDQSLLYYPTVAPPVRIFCTARLLHAGCTPETFCGKRGNGQRTCGTNASSGPSPHRQRAPGRQRRYQRGTGAGAAQASGPLAADAGSSGCKS